MAGDRTPDAAPTRFATAPGDRISFERELACGAGAFVNNLLAAAIAPAVAIWVVARYPITEQAAHDVRAALEARRGQGATAATAS